MLVSHPLLRRFENELNIGEHNLEWTIYGEDFFFRLKDSDVAIIWCCIERRYYANLLSSPNESERVAQQIKQELAKFQVWRMAFLENCDVFLKQEIGLVRRGKEREFAKFELPNPFSSPHNALTSPVELQIVVENSLPEIGRLKQVLNQPPEARVWFNVNWAWGTSQELEGLLQAMATLIRQPQHGSSEWQYHLKNRFSSPITSRPYNYKLIPNPASYFPFLLCLGRYFPVEVNKLVIYDKRGSYKENWPTINFSTKMPTSHEKIEAWMLWQDFLTGKIPPEEIKKLRDSLQL